MKKKVFIGLTEISGYYRNLANGLKQQGYEVTYITYNTHIFKYGGETTNGIIKLYKYCATKRLHTPKVRVISKILWIISDVIMSVMLFIWALFTHQIFIFGFATSFNAQGRDLFFLRLFQKIVISNIGHGSEARPTYLDGGYLNAAGEHPTADEIYKIDSLKVKRLKRIEQYSSHVIGAPFTAHFLKKPFVIANIIGLPMNSVIQKIRITDKQNPAVPIRILHGPSNPQAKGTYEIRTVIQKLKKEGYHINYVELQNRPHHEVLNELEQCDFVIDQLYSDTPLAGLGTEAAFYGKPTIIGGYLWDDFKEIMPEQFIAPSVTCSPEDIYSKAKWLIENPDLRISLGEKAKLFVQKNWRSDLVAQSYIRIIKNEWPLEWYADPYKVKNIFGAGLKKELVENIVRNIIEKYGIAGLHLSIKPKLEKMFEQFIKVN